MCGILAIFDRSGVPKGADAALECMKHRGPNHTGRHDGEEFMLGHHRLALQDLSNAGNQPMWDNRQEVGIVFNGEIYNFKEIREELKGHDFVSGTDTEVILYAYRKWGIEGALKRFNGMFSFVLYDTRNKLVYAARDRLGVKPLVYHRAPGRLYLASEIKALVELQSVSQRVDPQALADFLYYRYVPGPRTIYSEIKRLLPGHYASLDLSSDTLSVKSYWRIPTRRTRKVDKKEAAAEIERLLQDSVRLRLIADAPVATLLSGGVDSSLITALAVQQSPNITAFTIDLRPLKYSEIEDARRAAQHLGVRHSTRSVGEKEFRSIFADVMRHLDEPFADSSIIPTFALMQTVAQEGFRAALAGDGADELFSGYDWHRWYAQSRLAEPLRLLPESWLAAAAKFPGLRPLVYLTVEGVERYRRIMYERFDEEEIQNLFGFRAEGPDHLYKRFSKDFSPIDAARADAMTFLVDDILQKVDAASMRFSLEIRTPFLDYRLVEYAFSLLELGSPGKKQLLKLAAEEHLPPETLRKPKQGFSAPILRWVGNEMSSDLSKGALVKRGWIPTEAMAAFLQKETDERKLWSLFVLQKWLEAHPKATL